MMGATLAKLLLGAGYPVTVWNRTADKAKELVQQGASLAADPASALTAGEIIVVCVHDYKTSAAIFSSAGADISLKGKLIMQLSSGSPQEGTDSEAWAHARGARYLDGAIQAAPSQMGRADTPILVSGLNAAYQQALPILQVFGGNISYLGEPASLASAMDLATLSYVYGTALGFFHGARIVEAAGMPVDQFGALVAGIAPGFGEMLQHEANVIHSGDFTVSQSPTSISVDAVERILQQASESGINDEFPRYAASVFRRAAAAGYGNQEIAAIIKVLRANSPQLQS
jgi:3-hydroxyisobutyrate dehydrogenase-like beta-hydroxyacid dehydrogenase